MIDFLNDMKKEVWVEVNWIKITETIPFTNKWETIKNIFNERKRRYKLQEYFKDIWELPQMKNVVKKIVKFKDKKIVIVWDYDVDWITWSYVLEKILKSRWFDIEVLIPERTHWYWLNEFYINEANELWAKLLITVDNWTNAVEWFNLARSLWMEVIITDHHQVDEVHIEDDCVLNYNCYVDWDYAVWSYVAFRVWKALAEEIWEELTKEEERNLLPLCAMATIADVWILHWENRFIVEEYLPRLKNIDNKFFRMICEEFWWDSYFPNIWFWIAPVINAMWRYSRAREFYSYIEENDDTKLKSIIKELKNTNDRRRWYVKWLTENVLEQVWKNDKINIVIFPEDTLPWMLWLVASKLVDYNWRPSIALKVSKKKENWLEWSARTNWFELIKASEKISEDLDFFLAWHQQACWAWFDVHHVEEFKRRFNEEFKEIRDFNEIKVDTLLANPNDILDSEINFIDTTLWWHQFEPPSFSSKWFKVTKIHELWDSWDHFKLTLKDSYWEEHSAISFFWKAMIEKIKVWNTVDITYSIWFNNRRWESNRQLTIHFIKKIK